MMPRLPLSNLGVLVKKRRAAQKLREAAAEIGISAPTLLRVESGRIPDVDTFGRLCRWLNVDPGDFLGKPQTADKRSVPTTISAHFKAEKVAQPETLNALARMLQLVLQNEASHRGEHDA